MSFDKKCMRLGVITMLCALVANFLPVTYLYVTTGVVPTAGELGQILAMVSASFLIGWIL
jgi:membrane associated rhomboid family serine protease